MNPLQTSEQSSKKSSETSVPPSEKRCGCDEDPLKRVKKLILSLKIFKKLEKFREYIKNTSKYVAEDTQAVKVNEDNCCYCDYEISRVCKVCIQIEIWKEGVKEAKKEKQQLLTTNPWLFSSPYKLLRACIYSSKKDLETSVSRFLACPNWKQILESNGISNELYGYINEYSEEFERQSSNSSVSNPFSLCLCSNPFSLCLCFY